MKSGRKTALYVALVLFAMVLSIIPASTALAKPSLSKKKLTLYVDKSYTMKANGFSGKVTWKSSNKKIATVSSKGKVKAKKKGTVTITAKCGKEKKTCKVTVRPVKLSKKKMTVKKGQPFQLTLKCGASKGIKWKTSKKAVVKIKSKSKNKVTLQAVKPGKATITAIYKKKAYKCTVTVQEVAQQNNTPASSGTQTSTGTTSSGTSTSSPTTSSNTQTSSGTPTSSETSSTKITEVTITTGSASKTYDGKPLKNNEIKVTGFPEGKAPVITATGTITDVGTAKNTYSIDWGNLDPNNYKIKENLGTLQIVPATLTVTTGSASKPFDGTALTKTDDASLTGLVPGETADLNVTGSQTEIDSSDNTYEIIWGTAKKTNYVVKENLGKLSVMHVPIEGPVKITVDAGGHIGLWGRDKYPEDIKLYLGDADTPYPRASIDRSDDTLTAVYMFSNESTITVTVQCETSNPGPNQIACNYDTTGDISWVETVKYINTEIGIGFINFKKKEGLIEYTHPDGSFTSHKILDYERAWERYNILFAKHTQTDDIIYDLVVHKYIEQ